MKNIILILLLVSGFCGCSRDIGPADRALEFTRNAYTGKPMQAEEWLTKDMRTSKIFMAFGGIDALIKDSAAEAKRNKGVQAINIIKVTQKTDMVFVEVEVIFNNKEKSNGVDAWVLDAGKWKITKDKKADDSFK